MKKNNRTELVFILDRSGSMTGLESDTIGGFNSMIQKQKEEPGDVRVSTILFDHELLLLHDRMDLHALRPLTEKDYIVRGSTALLDAVGCAIDRTVAIRRHTLPEYRADKVLFVIITDGYENASRRYSYEKVKAMIELEKEKYGWEFIFLGANIDAAATAQKFGIAEDRAVNYHADSLGTKETYRAVGCAVQEMRQNRTVGNQWRTSIDSDYQTRKRSNR
ncbi:MAG: VWA domain-containing protein [Firmicutes bacterium]|nr:VWA domain-containing protein [Bacillota bacterium]